MAANYYLRSTHNYTPTTGVMAAFDGGIKAAIFNWGARILQRTFLILAADIRPSAVMKNQRIFAIQ